MTALTLGYTPITLPTGSKAVPLSIGWTDPTITYCLDFTAGGVGSNAMAKVQSVFVDNSQGNSITLKVDGVGVGIVIKPGVQGFYPIFMPTLSRLYLMTGSAGGQTSFFFMEDATTGNVYDTSAASATTVDTNIASAMEGAGNARAIRVNDDNGNAILATIAADLGGTLAVKDVGAEASLTAIAGGLAGVLTVKDAAAEASLSAIAASVAGTVSVKDTGAETSLAAIAASVAATLAVKDAAAEASLASIATGIAGTLSVVQPSSAVALDRSQAKPAIASLGTLLVAVAANAARNVAFVQNQSANDVYIILAGAGAVGPEIILTAAAANSGGGSWRETHYTGPFTVYGTAGSQIGSYEI